MAKFYTNGERTAKKDLGHVTRSEKKAAQALVEEWHIACEFKPQDVEAFKALHSEVVSNGKAAYVFDKRTPLATERFKCFKALAQSLEDNYTVNLYCNAEGKAVFEVKLTKDSWDYLFESAQ